MAPRWPSARSNPGKGETKLDFPPKLGFVFVLKQCWVPLAGWWRTPSVAAFSTTASLCRAPQAWMYCQRSSAPSPPTTWRSVYMNTYSLCCICVIFYAICEVNNSPFILFRTCDLIPKWVESLLGWYHQCWRILRHVLPLSCAISSSSCCCWAALRSSGLCITHWRSHWAMWSSGSCPASARDGEVAEAAGGIGVERWRSRCLRRSPGRKRSMTRAWSCREWWTRRPKRVFQAERDTKASYQPEQHDQSHCAYVLTQDFAPPLTVKPRFKRTRLQRLFFKCVAFCIDHRLLIIRCSPVPCFHKERDVVSAAEQMFVMTPFLKWKPKNDGTYLKGDLVCGVEGCTSAICS